jgi:hypothetical protein
MYLFFIKFSVKIKYDKKIERIISFQNSIFELTFFTSQIFHSRLTSKKQIFSDFKFSTNFSIENLFF